jgi:hypothetical protein
MSIGPKLKEAAMAGLSAVDTVTVRPDGVGDGVGVSGVLVWDGVRDRDRVLESEVVDVSDGVMAVPVAVAVSVTRGGRVSGAVARLVVDAAALG